MKSKVQTDHGFNNISHKKNHKTVHKLQKCPPVDHKRKSGTDQTNSVTVPIFPNTQEENTTQCTNSINI